MPAMAQDRDVEGAADPLSSYIERRKGRVRIVVRRDRRDLPERLGLWTSHRHESWTGVAGEFPGGRGRTVRIRIPGLPSLVAKPLLRGGLAGKVNRVFHYSRRRLRDEARLSGHLERRGVPVAPYVLGRAEGRFPFLKRLHVIFEEVLDAKSLHALLLEGEDAGSRLERAFAASGRSVRALHDAGVCHHDLNLGNLLIRESDSGTEAVLIDLDRSIIRDPLSLNERAANLARLYRHLVKRGFHRAANLNPDRLWKALLEAYGDDDIPPTRLAEAVRKRYRSNIFWHRMAWVFGRN